MIKRHVQDCFSVKCQKKKLWGKEILSMFSVYLFYFQKNHFNLHFHQQCI